VQLSASRLAAVVALAVCLCAGATEKDDFTKPQSAPRPRPKGLEIIDQGSNDPRLKGYLTPRGIKVEIVAEAPTVINPVGMTFADDGTPFVLEWRPSPGDDWRETPVTFTYKDGSTRKVATMKKRVKDVVKVLSALKENGRYDRARVVLEEELPSSILLHDGWLYLSGRGSVRRYKQSKDGGLPLTPTPLPRGERGRGEGHVKEVIAQGFCGFHHHQVSGMTIGNDGWLYLTSGDDDNYVEGSDGSRATVLRTGAIFRCRPDGSKMEVFSLGYRNPYRDVAFDTAGNMFHADNDNEDGSKFTGCRLMHVSEGSDFGWRLRQGARCCAPDPVRGAVAGELPGKVPPLLKTGRGAPAGLLIYNDTFFPEPYRGLLLYPDVYRRLIRAYRVEPDGATFKVVEEFELMYSLDPLFRPCQMLTGPDGAIYVVDWRTNSGGAGRLWGDGKNGRIYRLTWAGTRDQPAMPTRPMDSWAKIGKMSDEDLFKTLASDNMTDRQKAQGALVRAGDKHRAALLKLLADQEQPLRARIAALGALHSFWNADVVGGCRRLLKDTEADLRRLAVEALGRHGAARGLDVTALLEDSDAAVRRAAALALGKTGAPGAADLLVSQLAADEGKDVVLFDGLVRAVERLGKVGIERLVALAESGDHKKLDRAIEVFTMLRTRPGADAIPQLLRNPHPSVRQRAGLIRSYNNYLLDPPVSLEPALDYLVKHPDEALPVKLAGLEVLSANGELKGERVKKWLLGLLEDDDPDLRRAVLKAVADTRLREAAGFVARLVKKERRPLEERTAAAKALRVLAEPSVVPALKEVLDEKAKSAGQFALRREALRALAALDGKAAGIYAVACLKEKDRPLQIEAVQVLATRPEGARRAGQLFLADKLPRELLPNIAEALRSHAARDAEAATMLTAVLKTGLLLDNSPVAVARVRELVRTRGNPRRGRELFLNADKLACVKCHKMEGVGGSIGPDLTRLWDTHTVEKIMESIIDPDKEIKEGYQTYIATTKKGQVYSGLKISQSAEEVVLRDATGKDVRLARKDVETLEASKRSLMPANVVALLTYDQFIDLVAFLKDRAAQESLRSKRVPKK
jgi:putative membrane-bound dehydrogenase-like protein